MSRLKRLRSLLTSEWVDGWTLAVSIGASERVTLELLQTLAREDDGVETRHKSGWERQFRLGEPKDPPPPPPARRCYPPKWKPREARKPYTSVPDKLARKGDGVDRPAPDWTIPWAEED